MNILIPDKWLKEYVKTKATPKQIEKYVSLCGPSIEKVEKKGKDHIYHIEITTNRMDSAGVNGIAREVSAILPRFGIEATYKKPRMDKNLSFKNKVNYLQANVDPKLCTRFTAVLIKNVVIKKSPEWITNRLKKVGVRPINNIVDISNYIMHELGQPVHTFDYNKIKKSKMVLRASKKGEKITTLDNKTHTLPGEDIIIEDGEKRLIDLAGVMGGKNTEVDKNTKNVLLFVQTYNPVNIRKASMSLGQRTVAASLFEKGLDTELVTLGIQKAISLFKKLCNGKPEKHILDIYPNPYKTKQLKTNLEYIEKRLGITLTKTEISKYLKPLGFNTKWKNNSLTLDIPSFRSQDINVPEDIIEEIARIYGYHNFPSELMTGLIPDPVPDSPFSFEKRIKQTLKANEGIEVYTLSMTSKDWVDRNALKIKNPLGKYGEYMRTTLLHSLVNAAKINKGEEKFHLFEMANIYLPRKGKLPNERMTISGIMKNMEYRKAKGIVETLLEELNIESKTIAEDSKHFQPSKRLVIMKSKTILGEFGELEKNKLLYYSFDIEGLRKNSEIHTYKPIPKYPPQIEDITLTFPEKTMVGEVAALMDKERNIDRVELTTIYKENYTFRIWYQHPKKTLTDEEVMKIRKSIISVIKMKFGGRIKN